MSKASTIPPPARTGSTVGTAARWMLSFAGFPLGGLAASILAGPVDDLTAAVIGGVLTGAVLGAVQAWAMRAGRRLAGAWTLATAAGLAIGLALGASTVGFDTDVRSLAVQGAASGGAVGAAQAFVLRSRVGGVALLWPIYLAGGWALGWVVTTAAGVQVEEQFTVFGAAGAVIVALLTSVLPILLDSRSHPTQMSSS